MKFIRPHLCFVLLQLCFVCSYGNLDDFPLCAGRNVTSQPVIDFCESKNGTLEFRCCWTNDLRMILAVDLMNLNLSKVVNISDYVNINISVIDLRLNFGLKSLPDDFLTLTTLDALYLPQQYSCPGGSDVWEIINNTSDPDGHVCLHQKDFCANRTNVCTPKKSRCEGNGPNQVLCLCQTGYHGYKCLRENTFPTMNFLATTLSITVLMSGILYWTHRRNVKK